MVIFLWLLIKAQKALLRLRLAWLSCRRWGLRNRLRELETAMWYAREDQWWETRKRWQAAQKMGKGTPE